MNLEKRYQTEDFIKVTKEVFHNHYPTPEEKALLLKYFILSSDQYCKINNIQDLISMETIAKAFIYNELAAHLLPTLNKVNGYVKCFSVTPEQAKTLRAEFDHKNKTIDIIKDEQVICQVKKPGLKELLEKEIKITDWGTLACFLCWQDKKSIYNAYVGKIFKKLGLI